MENKSHLLNRLFVGVLAAACVAVSVTGCGDNAAKGDNAAQDAPQSTEETAQGNDTADAEESAQTGSEDETEGETDALPFDVLFSDSVRNDKTGRWRLSRISEYIEMQDYALDYYKIYFKSDDEIHAVVNFTTNTTTRISVLGGNLDVSVLEYVKGEEHDAAKLFGGDLLAEYWVNMETGEIEKIQ